MGMRNDIKKPFNILMAVIAIGAITLTIYFFFKSRRIQRPTYLISEEISKVYDSSKKGPNLIFLNGSGKKIEEDVFLVTVHFWNSGNIPIEPQDIREPVKFTISNSERIVDYGVVAQTSPKSTNFSLSPAGDQKSLIVNWTHLDPNNGAKFQVFYTGLPDPEFLFTGNILGNTVFVDGRFLGSKFATSIFGRMVFLGFAMFCLFAVGVFIGLDMAATKSRWRKPIYLLLRALLVVGALVLTVFALLSSVGGWVPPV